MQGAQAVWSRSSVGLSGVNMKHWFPVSFECGGSLCEVLSLSAAARLQIKIEHMRNCGLRRSCHGDDFESNKSTWWNNDSSVVNTHADEASESAKWRTLQIEPVWCLCTHELFIRRPVPFPKKHDDSGSCKTQFQCHQKQGLCMQSGPGQIMKQQRAKINLCCES